jgi:hypothetical protein
MEATPLGGAGDLAGENRTETDADSPTISTNTAERHQDLRRRGDGGGNHVQGSRIGQTIVLAAKAVKNISTGMSAADPPGGRLQMSQRMET